MKNASDRNSVQSWKTAILALIIALLPIVVSAQENSGTKFDEILKNTTPAERADFQTELMVKSLNLNNDQIEKIRTLNLTYSEKTDEVLTSTEPRFSKFKKIRDLRSAKEVELKAYLTDEQYRLYEQNKEEMKAKIREMIKERRQSTS